MKTSNRIFGALALLVVAIALPVARADQPTAAKPVLASQGTQIAIAKLFPVGGNAFEVTSVLGFPDKEALLPNSVKVLTFQGVCFDEKYVQGGERIVHLQRGQFYPGSTNLRITVSGTKIAKVEFD